MHSDTIGTEQTPTRPSSTLYSLSLASIYTPLLDAKILGGNIKGIYQDKKEETEKHDAD